MPKREPTPPLEDDFKYLIINYPFPLHANMQIASESLELAHWIASCIGQEHLTAIYHKPSAPNMVIIEVMKYCPRINALLGAHKWFEFLRDPEPDQVDMESRIYYCRYSTGREVQKHGWKRLDVWDQWFDTYDPINGPFVTNPYPKASYCEVPPETQTDYGLCRPLPSDVFPRPKPTAKQPIVPGSDVYVNTKKAGAQGQHGLLVAPIPTKQPVRSWANVVSPNVSHKAEVEWPHATSTASSENSSPVVVSAPPGLAFSPPPGLSPSANPSQASLDWGFESPISPGESLGTDVEIVTAGLAAAAIEDEWGKGQYTYKECNETATKDHEVQEQYWAEQPARPRDWDKPICPVHQVSCRAGICKVMDDIERKKKREAAHTQAPKSGDGEDGWEQTRPKGRGRGRGGGRGRGQTRGRGSRAGNGGWC